VHALTRDEAIERAALIAVDGYDIDLDLTTGAERFRTRTRVRFTCREPGRSTFIEHRVPNLRSVVLNGRPIDLASAVDGARITLDHLAAENELIVDADAAYSPTLEGLQRSVDPEDGEVYVFGESFLDFAQRTFACFDQPDLKAPLSVTATAPEGWTVLSNGAGHAVGESRWRFDPTPPLSTYLFALAAGPYHSVTAAHEGIPLGVWCRRSMAPYLDAEELLDVTRRGLDYYAALFGRAMPFQKYDQIFLPDLGGAMENAGLVTFSDAMLFRGPVTDDRHRLRAEVVLHELAHMWFGDLVTLHWWDDLWLNESFATYLAFRTLVEATRHRTAWAAFATEEKEWGYRQDALPTTHPIIGDVPDGPAALLNMDGITYSKGAGVLKQLAAWVGREAFDAGLRSYIAEHAFGNTTLREFLGALEPTSGRDLGPWAAEWLQTAGMTTLRARVDVGSDGRIRSVAVEQVAPPEQATLRSHRIAIGLYDEADGRLRRRNRLEVDIAGPLTPIEALAGQPAPALLIVNDDDLTWAKARLDGRTMDRVRNGAIPRVEDPLARALLWMAVIEAARDAELPVADAFAVVLDGLADARDIGTTRLLLRSCFELANDLGRPEHRAERLARLGSRLADLINEAAPGSDAQLAYVRASIDAAISDHDAARLRTWLATGQLPAGCLSSLELRWAMVTRLAVLGKLAGPAIDAELAKDPTLTGAEAAGLARASLPTVEAKDAAWQQLFADGDTSMGMLRSVARGFWRPEQLDLTRPYVVRYATGARTLFDGSSSQRAISIASRAFPMSHVEPSTFAAIDSMLADADLNPSLRRILVEGRHDLARAQQARELDASI
jgi:aminopeptidase N